MSKLDPEKIPRHVAIIPDGNGRWAELRNLPRNEGHRKGVEGVREIVRACSELGIRMLTLYAFSQENWDRPRDEVRALMRLLKRYLRNDADELHQNGIRVEAIGRLDQLDKPVQRELEKSSEISKDDSRRMQKKVQDLTDEYIEKIDQAIAAKEEEILRI